MTTLQSVQIAMELWAAVFCVIAAFSVFVTRRYDLKAADALLGLLTFAFILNISDAGAYFFRGNTSTLGFFMVRITNFLTFACAYGFMYFGIRYFHHAVIKRNGSINHSARRFMFVISGCGFALLLLAQAIPFYYTFDEQNRYYRLSLYPVSMIAPCIVMLLLFVLVIRNMSRFSPMEKISFILFSLFPFISVLLQIGFYGISISTLTVTITIFFFFAMYLSEYADAMVEREREMTKERLTLYSAQIQPHFIYNSLATLRSFLTDGSEARELLDHFTRFLRGSADLLTEAECVPATREFKMVTDYLAVEERRFQNQVRVVLELEDTDFSLPPFTVQTLVENAITHGIRRNENGKGTLTLRSNTKAGVHTIDVLDDGAGFDVDAVLFSENGFDEDEDRHTGLKFLQKRLAYMCNGELEVISTPGEGTRARVKIPCGKIEDKRSDELQ